MAIVQTTLSSNFVRSNGILSIGCVEVDAIIGKWIINKNLWEALTANYRFRGKVSERNKIVARPLRAISGKMPSISSGSSTEFNYANANGIIGSTVSIQSMSQRTFKHTQAKHLGNWFFCRFETAILAVNDKWSKLRSPPHVLFKTWKTGRFKGVCQISDKFILGDKGYSN